MWFGVPGDVLQLAIMHSAFAMPNVTIALSDDTLITILYQRGLTVRPAQFCLFLCDDHPITLTCTSSDASAPPASSVAGLSRHIEYSSANLCVVHGSGASKHRLGCCRTSHSQKHHGVRDASTATEILHVHRD